MSPFIEQSWHTFNVMKGETLCVVRVILSHNYDSSLGPMLSLALQRSKYNVRLISTEFEVMGPRSFLFSLTRSTFRIFPLLCQMKVPVLYELISLYRCTCDNSLFFLLQHQMKKRDTKAYSWVYSCNRLNLQKWRCLFIWASGPCSRPYDNRE